MLTDEHVLYEGSVRGLKDPSAGSRKRRYCPYAGWRIGIEPMFPGYQPGVLTTELPPPCEAEREAALSKGNGLPIRVYRKVRRDSGHAAGWTFNDALLSVAVRKLVAALTDVASLAAPHEARDGYVHALVGREPAAPLHLGAKVNERPDAGPLAHDQPNGLAATRAIVGWYGYGKRLLCNVAVVVFVQHRREQVADA